MHKRLKNSSNLRKLKNIKKLKRIKCSFTSTIKNRSLWSTPLQIRTQISNSKLFQPRYQRLWPLLLRNKKQLNSWRRLSEKRPKERSQPNKLKKNWPQKSWLRRSNCKLLKLLKRALFKNKLLKLLVLTLPKPKQMLLFPLILPQILPMVFN